MASIIEIEVSNSEKDGRSRRITRITNPTQAKPIEIFHEFDRIIPFTGDTPLDGHALAVLLYASSNKMPLRVHGKLTQTALRNMREIQMAWQKWKPEHYTCVDIIPDSVIDDAKLTKKPSAISAFSGGVDATFTALSHTKNLPEAVRYPLTSVLMMKGFDVDLGNVEDFQNLKDRVKPLLAELNLELRTIRTNSRELRIQNWYDSSALEIAACMQMLSDEFSYGLIGSGNSYDAIAIPSGSTPMIDHLLTTGNMQIIHDGAGYSRTEKVAEIIKYPTARKTVKVCWAGANQSGNCGKCEKCVRTRLNFILAGFPNPECFDGEMNAESIKKLYVENNCQMNEMRTILRYVKNSDIKADWAVALEELIVTWQPADEKTVSLRRYGSPAKQAAVKTLKVLGIDEPVKYIWRRNRRAVLKRKLH